MQDINLNAYLKGFAVNELGTLFLYCFFFIYAGHMFLYKCRRFYMPTYLEFFAFKNQMGLSPLQHVKYTVHVYLS